MTEFKGKPFTSDDREQTLENIKLNHMDEKRTICNVIRMIYATAQPNEQNLGAIREMALEAMWMGKRMNAKLTEYRQQEMHEEYINQDQSNLNCNYDMYPAQGNWD